MPRAFARRLSVRTECQTLLAAPAARDSGAEREKKVVEGLEDGLRDGMPGAWVAFDEVGIEVGCDVEALPGDWTPGGRVAQTGES